MDRRRFIEIAHLYYALAIVRYFQKGGLETTSHGAIRGSYFREGGATEEQEEQDYLEKDLLFEKALVWLSEQNIVILLPDDFGPSIIAPHDGAEGALQLLAEDKSTLFYKINLVPDPDNWVESALQRVNRTFDELRIEHTDYELPDQEWEPIPLDRNDPTLAKAIEDINKAAEAIRGDNGYAATAPEERNTVLRDLDAASEVLRKEKSVSLGYIRTRVVDALNRAIKRLKDGATGLIAQAARESILAWLKNHGIQALDWIVKSIL